MRNALTGLRYQVLYAADVVNLACSLYGGRDLGEITRLVWIKALAARHCFNNTIIVD